jgi:predicted dehydrogenase
VPSIRILRNSSPGRTSTPYHWHAFIAIAACRAGKDIYCEKPLSLTIHEARAMVKAARKHDRVFQTGSMQRSMSEFRKACELVRNGRIGQVKQVIVDVGGPSRPCDLPEEPMEPAGLVRLHCVPTIPFLVLEVCTSTSRTGETIGSTRVG